MVDQHHHISAKTVPELRNLLIERGISCNEYIKFTLVRLAQVALELQLPVIAAKDDYKVMNLKRRTIRSLAGEEIVAADKTTIISRFTKDLKELPCLEICNVLIYLLRCSAWSNNSLKNYRQDNSYKLYKD